MIESASVVMGDNPLLALSHGVYNGTSPMVSGYDYYTTQYWDDNGDPRSAEHWIMIGGPWKLFAITAAYCLTIVVGTLFMKNRPAFELRNSMLAYNILLVGINAFFIYESLVWTKFGARLFDFTFPSEKDRSEATMRISNMYQVYMWTKFIDYFDTFFFVLRKKNNQLTFLHIYHHITVPMIGWIAAWTSPTMPVLGLFALLNCVCHVIMYSYYALASLGPKVTPFLWWKRYITQVQLTQFVIITVYGCLMLTFQKGYPILWCSMPVIQGAIFFAMFGQFYIRSYMKAREQKKLLMKQSLGESKEDSNGTSGAAVDVNKPKAE